jgi:hypothetical protein
MADAADVRRLAMNLEGVEERQHFDRRAFRVKRIFATLAPDERSLNVMLTPDEQQMKTMMLPNAYSALPNKWGENGATMLRLSEVDVNELEAILNTAWQHAVGPARKR